MVVARQNINNTLDLDPNLSNFSVENYLPDLIVYKQIQVYLMQNVRQCYSFRIKLLGSFFSIRVINSEFYLSILIQVYENYPFQIYLLKPNFSMLVSSLLIGRTRSVKQISTWWSKLLDSDVRVRYNLWLNIKFHNSLNFYDNGVI